MPPAESSTAPLRAVAQDRPVVIPEIWLDECCEQVGLLQTLLRVLSGIEPYGEAHTLVADAIDCCDNLQELLNSIPVNAGEHANVTSARTLPANSLPVMRTVEPHFEPELSGDNFPVFAADEDEQLPTFAEDRRPATGKSGCERLPNLRDFYDQAAGDLRELELLSLGRDWTRMTRMAAGLKDAAVQVSAQRVAVDAAALEAATRDGRRHEVDLALDALRADLRDCVREINDSLVTAED